jgi:xanthine dehydrogenase accessory factor
MGDEVLVLAQSLSEAGEPFVLATVVRCERPTSAKPGAKALIRQDGTVTGWVGGSCAEPVVLREALRALRDRRPRFIALVGEGGSVPTRREGILEYPMTCHSGGTIEVFVEPILPKAVLVIAGRGPVADALAGLADAAGLAVHRAPPEPAPESPPRLRIPPGAFVAVMSHGSYDEEALQQALESDASYVSLVASRRRADAVIDVLRRRGMSDERLRRLKAPAGLDIGAVTPQEIAVSILAEIVQVSRRQAADLTATESGLEDSTEGAAIDPVCGMVVVAASARHYSDTPGGRVYFCGGRCKETFDRDPARFAAGAAG